MSKLLFVVLVACVFGRFTKVSECEKFNETADCGTHPDCFWEPGYGRCMIPCHPNISDREWGNENDSKAWVDSTDGDDANDGSKDRPLKSIEQVKHCYGHFTEMYLAANASDAYDLTPPANLSRLENESDIPWFYVYGDEQGSTIIQVEEKDYQSLNIEGAGPTYVICYVIEAYFNMTNITVNVLLTQLVESTLIWVHHADSEATLESVTFTGEGFPKHLFIHTGGKFSLKNVQIAPTDKKLPGNIISWHGKAVGDVSHKGFWNFNNLRIDGPSDSISYAYPKSLLEQELDGKCELEINIENSVFKNIRWDNTAGPAGLRRQKNEDVPVGLALTVDGRNPGQVNIIGAVFEGNDVSRKPFAAPLAIASVSKKAPYFNGLNFTNNKGNSSGGIASNANYSLENCAFDENVPYDLAALVDGVVATLDEATKKNGVTTDNRLRIAGEEDNGLPIYAWAIIIAVSVVVVAAIVVIVSCAVYYRNKKYSTLSDEEYDESSSSSLRSSEKENEMDSA